MNVKKSSKSLIDREDIKIEKLEQPPLEDPQWLQEQSKNGVQIKGKMYYDDALRYLHEELHNLEI